MGRIQSDRLAHLLPLAAIGLEMRVMKTMAAAFGLFSALALAPASAQTPPDVAWTRYPTVTEVKIEDAAAVVIIEPQMRGDSAFVILNPGPLPDPQVRVRGGRLILDGNLRRIRDCESDGAVTVAGHGRVTAAQLPVIYVRTPDSLVFEGSGALRVTSGPALSAQVALAGCSTATLGPVADQATVSLSGAASARIGPAARARVGIAGAGVAQLGPVSRDLDIAIAGDGHVSVATVSGPVRVAIQGDGYVDLGQGHAADLRVAIAGQGHVRFEGAAETVSAAIAGSGLVEVGSVEGAVEQRVAGSGGVRVGAVGRERP